MKENFKKVFLDTSPIIYLLDGDVNFGQKTSKILSMMSQNNVEFVSSVITCAEYLVYPYKMNNDPLIEAFWEMVRDNNIVLYTITHYDAIEAAKIRAKYKYFKLIDSLQLAVACLQGCDLFLTNDSQLTQFTEIKCATIADWQFD